MPVEKNKEYEIEITSVSSEGNGVGDVRGYTVFVPQTARGDVVLAEIIKVKSRYATGRLKRILKPSPYRVEPACGMYDRCGGCQLMHMDYSEQLRVKWGIVKNALLRIGGFKNFELEPIRGMAEPLRYRNKLIFQVGHDAVNKPVCGFYENKSHTIVPVSDCLTGDKQNRKIIDAVLEYMRENRVSAYNEKTGRGIVRGIFIRKSVSTGEIMTVICANARKLPAADSLVCRLKERGAGSVILNVNTKRTNLSLGNENITLYGSDYITDTLLGINFKISARSFFQINPVMTERLYNKALEYADLKRDERVMDIYCGIGTISLCAAKRAKEVIGIEIVEQAVRDAEKNKSLNEITNVRFYAGSAENIAPKLIAEGWNPKVVILDPPRKGSDEKTLSAIVKAAPSRIVYVSCDPATLARDLRFLADRGYCLKKAMPFDMFPQTCHVETIMLLQRQDT